MSKTKARMTSAAPARITAASEATGRRRGGHTNRADHRHHFATGFVLSAAGFTAANAVSTYALNES